MNNVAAIKWTLAKIKEQGADVTLAQLDQRLASESLSEVDRQDCREWLDGVLSKQGPHTCTLDHPAALPTYKQAGFVQYKEEKIQREL